MPFRWNNMTAVPGQLPTDQPLHAQLRVDDLSILALAGPFIDSNRTTGVLTATVDANAPGMSAPFAGTVNITNASLGFTTPPSPNLPGGSTAPSTIDTYLKNINATVTFDQTHAVVQSFTGDSSVKGSFAVTGGATFGGPANLDLQLALKAFQINEHSRQSLMSRLYASAAQGTLNGTVAITGPITAPLFSNSDERPIALTAATLGLPSPQPATPGPTPTYAVDPHFDLHFSLGTQRNPVSVKKPPLISADVYGTADVGGRLSAPELYAPLVINRGSVILFGPVLRITPGGTVALRYPVTNPDTSPDQPRYIMSEDVNLVATTTVSANLNQVSQYTESPNLNTAALAGSAASGALSNADTQRTQYHITVAVEGPLSNPDMRYTSDPYLDKQQILGLLTPQSELMGILRGGNGDAVASELTQAINSVGVGMLLNPVESNIAAALGLSSFVIDYSPDAPVAVTLVAPLGHRFEASFQRAFGARAPSAVNNLTGNPLFVVKLSYKITNLLRLSVSTDDQQNNTVALEGVIYFDRLPKVEKKRKSAPTPPTAAGPPPPGTGSTTSTGANGATGTSSTGANGATGTSSTQSAPSANPK